MSTDTNGAGSSTDVNQHKKCCDPFKCHKRLKKTGLRTITSDTIRLHQLNHIDIRI